MDEFKNRQEPKKIKLTPIVDRSEQYDALSFDNETLPDLDFNKTLWQTPKPDKHENNNQNNSQSIQSLDSDSTD